MQTINIQFEKLIIGDMFLYSYLKHITNLQQIVNGVPNWQMVIYPPNKHITPLHFVVILQKSNYQYMKKWIFDNTNCAINYHKLKLELKQQKLI